VVVAPATCAATGRAAKMTHASANVVKVKLYILFFMVRAFE